MAKKRLSNFNIPDDPEQKPSWLAIGILLFIAPPIGTFVALGLGAKRLLNEFKRSRYRRFRRYANTIGNRTEVSIREVAATLGMPAANLEADLQAMIDQGFIEGNPHIDHAHMRLYMDAVDASFAEQVINVFVSADDRARTVNEARARQRQKPIETDFVAEPEQQEPAQAQPKERKAEKKKTPPQPRKTGYEDEDFEEKLRELRELNDQIRDKEVSDRIDRIGALTASIFRVVHEKPEHAEEVRKFMNYYLPTTLKLLKSYSLMEKQSYQGENIQASRKKIESVLDRLIVGFQELQDRLFRTEALDVETDITVLDTMLASDGLTDQKLGLRTQTSGGGQGK